MLSRFSCLRCVLTNASKFVTTRKSFPVSNLLLHTANVNWNRMSPVPLDPPTRPKVAVVIGPCGDYDGTNPIEVICLCTHMYKRGFIWPEFYAPDYTFVDLPTDNMGRSVKQEAARLVSFHPIYDLGYLRHHDYIGLAILGGGGVIRLLSDIYDNGEKRINQSFRRQINEFLAHRKPIFCTSEANLLLAAAFKNVEIAIGDQPIECPWTDYDIPMWEFAQFLDAKPMKKEDFWIDRKKNIISIPGTSRKDFRLANLFASFDPLVHNMAEQTTQLWQRVQQDATTYHNSDDFRKMIDDFYYSPSDQSSDGYSGDERKS